MSFSNLLSTLAVAFALSVILTPVVRALALRFELGDKPNGRRVHIRMIPHLGGVALVAGVTGALAVSAWVPGWVGFSGAQPPLAAILFAVAIIVTLGLVDDMKSLRAMHKLLVQVVAAVVLVTAGMVLSTGTSGAVSAGAVALSVIFFIGIPSAVNLVDGHDGLAAGTSLISAAAFAAIAAALGADMLIVGSLAVVGACAGFLVFNFPPGTIYMGDTGSMFLGTMLAVIACLITTTAPSFLTFIAVCLVLGVPALDAVLAVARRVSLRSPVFGADSLHMHHVLVQAGFSPRQVLGVIWSLQVVLAALGVATAFGLVFAAVAGCLVLLSAFVWFLRQMVAVRPVGGRVAPDVSAAGSIPLRGDRAVELGQRGTVGR